MLVLASYIYMYVPTTLTFLYASSSFAVATPNGINREEKKEA